MISHTLLIRRLSSFTLLKIIFITTLFPWVIIDTSIILFHLFSGDFVVDGTREVDGETVKTSISLWKFVLISYPAIVLANAFFAVIFWIPATISLWLWSLFRPLKIKYYEN